MTCIHRLFPCGVCRCPLRLVTQTMDICFALWPYLYVVPTKQNKRSLSVWLVTREQGHASQGNSLWIQDLCIYYHAITALGQIRNYNSRNAYNMSLKLLMFLLKIKYYFFLVLALCVLVTCLVCLLSSVISFIHLSDKTCLSCDGSAIYTFHS